LPGQQLAFSVEIVAGNPRPRRDIIKPVAGGARGGQQQLDRCDLAGEPLQLQAELRQFRDRGVFEQRQQRLADHPALVAHALQQQVLAVLVRLAELRVQEQRHQRENQCKQARLRP